MLILLEQATDEVADYPEEETDHGEHGDVAEEEVSFHTSGS